MRDLKVWFPLRRGLLREMVGGEALWVRAVDGVSFDLRNGEVHCLVGESGCGKTTTGKALLGLVTATEGDIFIEMSQRRYAEYERALATPQEPTSARTVDALRRRYSLTWKENRPWSLREASLAGAFLAVAIILALDVCALAVGLVADPFGSTGLVIGVSIAIGVILGTVSVLPPTRPSRRTPVLAAALGILAINLLPIYSAWIPPVHVTGRAAFDALGSWGAAWARETLAMIVGVVLAASIAGGLAKTILAAREESEGLSGVKMKTLRRRLHLIFQDPYESLNPKQSVFEIVEEPLKVNGLATDPEETTARVSRALSDAGLRPPEDFMLRFPHELSGGQRQRVSIAAALVLEPDLIVADEPVSMLDVSIRTEILQLMMDLRRTRGLTYLFITHDLSLAWVLADRISVMYLGKIVESGTAEEVIGQPKHPYTQALISVVPSPDPRKKTTRVILKGERPDSVNIPAGCRFHPRCPMAFEKCGWTADEVVEELESLRGEGRLSGIAAIQAQDTTTLGIAVAPGVSAEIAAESIRSVVSTSRGSRLALKGIADVHVTGGYVYASLHPWSEPLLVEVAAGNAVACHLVTPPAEAVSPVTA